MLLTNRLSFFDKRGNEINLSPDPGVLVTVIDETGSGGGGAVFNVYTNRNGNIEVLEIVSGGQNYDISGQAYLQFKNALTGYTWDSNPADLSVDPLTGAITGFTGLANAPGDYVVENAGFPYPAVTWKGEMYFDIVSTGLVENQDIFILEKVDLDMSSALDVLYAYPRAEEGPANILGYFSNMSAIAGPPGTSNEGTGSVEVKLYSFTGNVTAGDDRIFNILSTSSLTVGMRVDGPSFTIGTTIAEIIDINTIRLSNKATLNGVANSYEAYAPHGFIAGMKIRVGDDSVPNSLSGTYTVTNVSDRKVFFTTPASIPTLPSTLSSPTGFFRAAPVWRGRMVGLEDEIFMFTVEYGEDYPVITKVQNLVIEPFDSDALSVPDFYYTGGLTIDNTAGKYQYRSVSEDLEQKMMRFHLAFSAGTEGSYVKLFVLEDITFPYAPAFISQVSLRGEAEDEDPRLARLLQNFGRDVTQEQELIIRDSDVNESLPDYRLLNRKRKEMLLQGDQIWPYLGSYKGLVNIINWFGYYDIRIKEYWLNVNKDDTYYGKYKQIQIPFQLEERGVPYSSIDMLPSKVYKKTNKFGLFYDLNRESGVLDENGVPLTIDAFQFSNEEVLIKLFALKQYLINTFLPLSAKIVDIVGEGVYYERYAANTWNDRVDRFVVDLTRQVDFRALEERIQIVDAREYDNAAEAFIYEPGVNTLSSFYSTYNIEGIQITTPATVTSVPQLSVATGSGNASPTQVWAGLAYIRALAGSYIPGLLSSGGLGYQVGDVITLSGGAFTLPVRVRVTGVIPGGSVTSFEILAGLNQGDRYLSLPQTFSQISVVSEDLLTNTYYAGIGTGFQLDANDIQYEIHAVKTTTIGKGYPVLDTLVLNVFDPSTSTPYFPTYTFNTKLIPGPKVGYFKPGKDLLPLTNEPNVPVAAFLDLEALGFEVVWDEMSFSWNALQGASDAVLKAYVDPLPGGSGSVLGIEIVSPGSGYTLTPAIQFSSGGGSGATAISKLLNGQLQILSTEIISASPLSSTVSRLFLVTPFSITNIPYSLGAMVFGEDTGGNAIPIPAVITALDTIGGTYIDIEMFTTNFTSVPGNFFVNVHEGAVLTAAGSGYEFAPNVKTVGGHTNTLYTWEEIGRGNFYEMKWIVNNEPGTPNFFYDSGQKSIDELITHTVKVPYKGLYRVELIVYDTDNNWINEIKRDYVEAWMPEATTAMVTRYVGPSYPPGAPVASGNTNSQSNIRQLQQNCVDTWDEGIFQWDEYWGRWINPFKTWTTWNDCDIEWSTLEVTPLSEENNWTYPPAPDYPVYRVSAYDNLVGPVISYDSLSLTAEVQFIDVQNRPEVQVNEWLFFRRDDLTFQVQVSAVNTLVTTVQYTFAPGSVFPQNFLSNPTAWEVLREVGNTVVIEDDLYTPDNGKTLVPGQFITLDKSFQTPLNDTRWSLSQPPYQWGIPINAKVPDPITSLDAGISIDPGFSTDPFLTRNWVNGQIYQYRNLAMSNGSFDLWSSANPFSPATVYLERLVSPTEENWGNRGMFYINNTAGSPFKTTADPIGEIRPGFTVIDLVIGEPDDPKLYNYILKTSKGVTNSWARPYTLVNSSGTESIWVSSPISSGVQFAEPLDPLTISSSVVAGPSLAFDAVHIPSIQQIWYSDSLSPTLYAWDENQTFIGNIFPLPLGATRAIFKYDPHTDTVWAACNNSVLYQIDPYSPGGTLAVIPIAPIATPGGIEYDPVNKRIWVIAGNVPYGTTQVIDADPLSPNYQTIIQTITHANPLTGGRTLTYIPYTQKMFAPIAGTGTTGIMIDCATYTETTITLDPGFTGAITTSIYHPVDGTLWILNATLGQGIQVYDVVNDAISGIIDTYQMAGDIVYSPQQNSMFAAITVTGRTQLAEFKGVTNAYPGGKILYQQHFRTIDMYKDTSNQGWPWSVWSETGSEIICIEAVTLDGKKFDEIYEKLSLVDNASVFAWIEYKYDVFPTRTYINKPGVNLDIYMDFNTRPILPSFETSTLFPANQIDGTGWYYDHGISQGNFAVEVTNVGRFEETPGWTIVTVNDPNDELYRCDSTFLEKARDFDEDYAETHLGVKLVWDEVYEINWQSMCSQTWGSMDWPYTLYANYRWFVNGSETFVNTIRLNEDPGFSFDLTPCVGGPADIGTRAVSILNNTFYDPTPTIPGPSLLRNENPELTKFDYRIQSVVQDSDTQVNRYGLGIINVYCTWGDPLTFDLVGDSSGLSTGYFQYSEYIQPGWTISATAPNLISLAASPSAVGALPWIPSAVITADLVSGSKILTNITGFEADFPQGGWIYDPVTNAVVGMFGPGVGAIEEDSGFVIYIEMDTPSAFTASGYHLEVYPHRSGLVQFIDFDIANYTTPFVYASAKNPGTAPLGYLRGYYDDGVTPYNAYSWWPSHNYDPNRSRWNHSYPLGNYYEWVGNPEVFYGGGLETSTLQFSQPYRHAQTYIYEGGSDRLFFADGGGWYPSITWGSYGGWPDGGFNFSEFPDSYENLYKPITKVTIYDINNSPVTDPFGGILYLILNTWFDGSAIVYTDSTNAPFDFISVGVGPGDNLTIYLEDIDGDGESQVFSCVVVDPFRGILGKSVTYFSANYSQDLTLLYDYESYKLTNIMTNPITGQPFVLYPGMVVGNRSLPLQFLPPYSTRITEVNEGQTEAMISSPNTLPTSVSLDYYAYAPLDLPFKLQPTNEKIWSRTKQWDSMRYLYDRAFNSAFTWEDTTIALRERKIPVGASILFSSDASDIAGKTKFNWNLYKEDGTKLVSIVDPDFLWTFLETGLYDLELEITDTNGNTQKRYNKNFVEIFLPEQS